MSGRRIDWRAQDYADVRWRSAGVVVDGRQARRVPAAAQQAQVSALIAIVLLLACTAVSLFDLALLMTS